MSAANDQRFEALYREHGRAVFAYCLRRASREDAKDVAADVFVVAWRRFDAVPLGEEALPWLYGVARKILANRERSHRRLGRLVAKLWARRDHPDPGPEPQVVRRSEHEELLVALDRLSAKDREVLRLVEWEEVPREKVAEMFGVTRAAIDQRMSRAYKKLARSLGVPARETITTPRTTEEGGEA